MMKQATATAICILVFFLCVLPAAAQGGFTFTQIARSTMPAPVPSELRSFAAAGVSNGGQVAFSSDSGVFLNTGGTVSLVAALGTAAPGGGKFLFTGPPAINAGGQVLFQAFTTAPSHSGMFLFANNQITQLVRDQSAAFSGNAFTFEPPSINDVGDIAFTADTGIFMKSGSTISKVAAIGDPVPGGGTFAFFSGPLINHDKQVVFVALTTVGSGIYASNGGTLSKIVASGDTSPLGGQFFFFNFLPANLSQNDAGQIAFSAFVSGPSGIFVWSNGTLTLPVANNTVLPGGETLLGTNTLNMNNAGDIAFEGSLSGEASNQILLFSGGTLKQLTQTGQSAPGGGHFEGGLTPWVNSTRQVAFVGRIAESNGGVFLATGTQMSRVAGQGDPVPGQPRYYSVPPQVGFNRRGTAGILGGSFPGGTGLFLGRTTGTRLVAHLGDALPGGGVLTGIITAAMNNNDQMAFEGQDSGLGFDVVLGSANSLTHIARTGDLSPDGGTFSFLGGSVSINNLGQVAFPASTTGSSQAGMFLSSNGQITELFDQNAAAPGGGTIGQMFAPAINDGGEVAFFAQPQSGGGIFLFSQGTITSIARNGQAAPGGGMFNISPGFNTGPFINGHGDIVFSSFLTTGGTAVYRFARRGTLNRIAGPGDVMPGGGTLTAASDPTINENGQVAFTGQIGTDFTIFLRISGMTMRVAGKGDVAPGGTEIVTANTPKINNQGQIAFSAGLNIGSGALLIATPTATK